jgi:hypothetical protein
MKLNVYGRFLLEVRREDGEWIVCRSGKGLRIRANDLVIPAPLDESEITRFLDDLLHEFASPGQTVQVIYDSSSDTGVSLRKPT